MRFTSRYATLARSVLIPLGCSAFALAGSATRAAAQTDSTHAQKTDSTHILTPVTVSAGRAAHAVQRPPAVSHGIIFSGKTAEIVHVDSTGTTAARDITRQVIGRIPGANIAETEASGFPANGIGFRGLDPTQSIELNVRQDGVNIAGDLYGYNETYYSPPTDIIEDIQVVRGASSLAYGPQFGGAINYLLKSGTPGSAPMIDVHQNVGSFGLFDTYGSVNGGTGRWTYLGALQHRSEQGWRPNSDYDQTDAFARIGYSISSATDLDVEYTRFRNQIHMPGGLTDAEFDADPDASYRSRNWLATPWNILAINLTSHISEHVRLYVTSSLMLSQRYLVWRNEDGGAQVADSIDPTTNQYVPREVEREKFFNVTNEARLQIAHDLFRRPNTLTVGLREFTGNMLRLEDGPGTTGTDFNMDVTGAFGTDLHFGTANVAAFAENLLHVTDRWSITPGVRAEWLQSTISGYTEDSPHIPSQTKDRSFALGGLGTEYVLGAASTVYANISQAYRPITYDALTPFGSTSRISPDLQDGRGYDLDLGWRGNVFTGFSATFTGFYMWYGNRAGLYSGIDTATGSTYTEQATIGNSVAQGVEASASLSPFVAMGTRGVLAGLTLFDAAAYDDAHYVSGVFKNNRVERAPVWINRVGLNYNFAPVSTTLQLSTQTHSFTDANNTVRAPDNAGVGSIPGYAVVDWSIELTIAHHYRANFAIDNLTNVRYFTERTTEYPGPGIIPSLPRSIALGVSYTPGR